MNHAFACVAAINLTLAAPAVTDRVVRWRTLTRPADLPAGVLPPVASPPQSYLPPTPVPGGGGQ